MPQRIQRRRSRGWEMPANAVLVCRPAEWGNPYRVGKMTDLSGSDKGKVTHTVESDSSVWSFATKEEAHTAAVALYRHHITHPANERLLARAKLHLRGKDMCCWCAPDIACHADVLLELANA